MSKHRNGFEPLTHDDTSSESDMKLEDDESSGETDRHTIVISTLYA